MVLFTFFATIFIHEALCFLSYINLLINLVYLLIGFKSETSCLTAHSLQFIRVIMAVVVTITLPASRDTVTIETGELLWLTAFPFVLDTVFAIVGQIPRSLVRALALWT